MIRPIISLVVALRLHALKLLNHDNDKKIHLWLNKDIEIHDFDADPGWLGPKNMSTF